MVALAKTPIGFEPDVSRLLFFERRHNRRIVNAAALCTELSGRGWDARVFVEPEDLDFCAQVKQRDRQTDGKMSN